MVKRGDYIILFTIIVCLVFIVLFGSLFVKDVLSTPEEITTTETTETTRNLKNEVSIFLSENSLEAEMIAKVLYREARGVEDKAQIAAVGWCILNRVDSPNHPNTIVEVITEPEQFAWEYETPIEPELLRLSKDILMRWYLEKQGYKKIGRTLPKDYCFFVGDGEYNYFRNSFETEKVWNWSYPSPY